MHDQKSKLLFTPGPLSTSQSVKQAMLRDVGSRDAEFLVMVREIRRELLQVGAVQEPDYTTVLLQGSGTFAVEATLGTVVPRDGRLLVAVNGAYGQRMVEIAARLGIPHLAVEFPENEPVSLARLASHLDQSPRFTHLACVHCETTTGLLNPIEDIGELCSRYGVGFLVDAMSSFGGIPFQVAEVKADFLISSANKCIEGVPGFGFVLARRQALERCEGLARSLSLDLFAQWRGFETDGQFRFTPPTHSLLAFRQALRELAEEGGVPARYARYRANQELLRQEMRALGFETYVRDCHQSPMITCFLYPQGVTFDFTKFYSLLSERGFLIYPGKLSRANTFRIGTIGRISQADIRALLSAIREILPALAKPDTGT
ncbi:MAG: 2-aminoethylphosphonate--pyruvate transaminase [Bryobacteraceae bacterium]|nr:2-aminoethylphosphonate--pyruvate transaminase [Bryobacteraceae bacterium]MDW8377787.1 2-aminoethylphosphonate--pyruvate transaminase [Bryobacterales bacterium]